MAGRNVFWRRNKPAGAAPITSQAALDPNSDEYEYLRIKQGQSLSMDSGALPRASSEAELTALLNINLAKAWADFKATQDELKAKGYDYFEIADGVYGKPIKTSMANVIPELKHVTGPKGNIYTSYGINDKLDDGTKDLIIRAKAYDNGPRAASDLVNKDQAFQTLKSSLLAKGVDLAKLEKDNPLTVTYNQISGDIPYTDVSYNFGANTTTTTTQKESPWVERHGAVGGGNKGAALQSSLDPTSEEAQYLAAKQRQLHLGFSTVKIDDTTKGLASAWAQFKADNEKLKNEGYNYYTVKDGFYGKPVASADGSPLVSADVLLTKVIGPKGDILGSVQPTGSELETIRKRAKYPVSFISDASQQYSTDQKVDELSKSLIAKGVDLVKLEKDNPAGIVAGYNSQNSTNGTNGIVAESADAARRTIGGQRNSNGSPAPGTIVTPQTNTGLARDSDEFQYLARKQGFDRFKGLGYPILTVAEYKAELKTAWANFKAVNDELKAKGYSYYEAKDGMYGATSTLKPGVAYGDVIKKVDGPKGDINNIYGTTPDGKIVNPIADPNSPKFDKGLRDLKNKYNQSPQAIMNTSANLGQAQAFQDIKDRLVAKGVDLVKLEKDNPAGTMTDSFGQELTTFGATTTVATDADVARRTIGGRGHTDDKKAQNPINYGGGGHVSSENPVVMAPEPPRPQSEAEVAANVAAQKAAILASDKRTYIENGGPNAGKLITAYQNDRVTGGGELDPELLAKGINKRQTSYEQDEYGRFTSMGMINTDGTWQTSSDPQKVIKDFEATYGKWDPIAGKYVKFESPPGTIPGIGQQGADGEIAEYQGGPPLRTNRNLEEETAVINNSNYSQDIKDKALFELHSGSTLPISELLNNFANGAQMSPEAIKLSNDLAALFPRNQGNGSQGATNEDGSGGGFVDGQYVEFGAPPANEASVGTNDTPTSVDQSKLIALQARAQQLEQWGGPGYDGMSPKNDLFPDVTTDAQYKSKLAYLKGEIAAESGRVEDEKLPYGGWDNNANANPAITPGQVTFTDDPNGRKT